MSKGLFIGAINIKILKILKALETRDFKALV